MEYLNRFVWLLVLASFAVAFPADVTNDPPTTTDDYERPKPPSSYAFAFETENGQVRDENIELDPQSPPAKMEVKVKGSYSFISADGYEYTVFYKANKKGYQPYVTAHKIKVD